MFKKFRRTRSSKFFFLLSLVFGIIFLMNVSLFTPAHEKAKKTVETFYHLEQAGNFGGSWELFHSQMKLKFSKDTYIQRRAHVFMQDFAVKSFEYKLGNFSTHRNWKMDSKAPALDKVYEVPITMIFHTAFGNFDIHQIVYVCLESNEWRVLWSYANAQK